MLKPWLQKNVKKSCASNHLVLIKHLMVAASVLVLFILSRSSLPYKRISVNWALFKSKILGSICLTALKRVILSCKYCGQWRR